MLSVLIGMTLIAVVLSVELIRTKARVAELERKKNDWL